MSECNSIENSELTCYQKNRDVMLSKANDYCKNNKERLREQARDKYRNLFEEAKNKKRKYGKDRYHNIPEEKKQRLNKYQKNIMRQKKSQYNNNKIVF